jgi:hypothetical protein
MPDPEDLMIDLVTYIKENKRKKHYNYAVVKL